MSTCTFFGHRDAPKKIEPILRSTLIDLIEHHRVTRFYVGNHGQFDAMVAAQLRHLQGLYPIRYAVVLAYLPPPGREAQPDTLYPEGLEHTPPRFAIDKRNRWMLDRADHVVTYVTRPVGGAAQFRALAKRKGKTVWELSEYR